MKITVPGGIGNHTPIRTTVRCPHCGKEAVMEALGQHDYAVGGHYVCGQRRCPNPACHGHLFVVFHGDQIVKAYPPIRLDFDPEDIPSNVLKTFEEAITCHSQGCFVAAAIMVRRTLEEVCVERKATGKDLKARINDLRSKIVIPGELLDAMDELRILGNDAAHIEAKDYDAITDIEVTVAIQFSKEILKSLYQYSSLLGKLRALKK
jgi:transcription elongation factor Elf1